MSENVHDNFKTDISIIIPLYNGEKTIEKCLNTLLVDSDISHEIIVINDNSTDNSANILNQYKEKYNFIKIINNETNQGAGISRNKGIDVAAGEFISFVDCDDWVDCNLYSVVLDCIKSTDSDIAVFGVKDEYSNFFSSNTRYSYQKQITFSTKTALNLLTRNTVNREYISPMVCQKIYRRVFLTKNRLQFVGNRHFEDDIFSYISFLHAGKVVLVPNVYYHYMQSPYSVSHILSKEYINEFTDAFQYIKNKLVEQDTLTENKHTYLSYFDKCLSSLFSIITSNEQDTLIQKEYVYYLFSSLQKVITLREIIDYIDLSRIRKLWI